MRAVKTAADTSPTSESFPKRLWQARSFLLSLVHKNPLHTSQILIHRPLTQAKRNSPTLIAKGRKKNRRAVKMKKFFYVAATIAAFILSCGARWTV